MSPKEKQDLREKFEKQIIGQVADFSTPRDRVIAVLAHVYPLDEDAIPDIAGIPLFETVEALNELKTLMFVKTLPGRHIKLHDYAQALVERYVWPLEEDRGGSRLAVSQTCLSYLAPRIEKLQSQISSLGQQIESGQPDGIDNLMLERDKLEYRLLAVFQYQYLEQLSYIDPLKAFDLFQQLIKQADRTYRPILKSGFVRIMQRKCVRAQLNHDQLYELELEHCKALAVVEEYEKALSVAEDELLPLVGTSPERSVEIALHTGRWYVRLGQIQQGLSLFQEAIEESRQHSLSKSQVEAEEKAGWACRLLCEWEEARRHYFKALALNAEIGNPLQEASLLINLAFVQSYLNRDVAGHLCLQAIERLERIQDRFGLGRAYSTQGCINYQIGRLEDALIALGRALEIFEPAGDREWIGTVYSWRGATYWGLAHHARVANRTMEAKENLAQAERDLEYALSICAPKDKPMTLHRLARVCLDQGRIQEAQQCLEQCYQQSQTIPDIWYQIASLRDLARIAVYRREFERLHEFEEKATEYTAKWTWKGRPLGGMYLQLGNLALGKGWMEVATSYYGEGMELIALDQSYGGIDFGYHVHELKETISSLTAPETLGIIGTQLTEFWKVHPVLCDTHPEAVVLFSDWRTR
jgi:tetratricopeptide (TPR) repeat protein